MNSETVIIIPCIEDDGSQIRYAMTKMLVSSLLRTHFSGKILVITNCERPLFLVGRSDLVEISVDIHTSPYDRDSRKICEIRSLEVAKKYIKADENLWCMVMMPGCLSLRNIDHLLPSYSFSPSIAVDIISSESVIRDSSRISGFFVCRSLDYAALLRVKILERNPAFIDEPWIVDGNRNLKFGRFEKFEISQIGEQTGMREILSSAITILDDISFDRVGLRILQSLYFGCFFGDDNCFMVSVMDI